MPRTSTVLRPLARVVVGVGALAAVLALPGTAEAHITVQPGEAAAGGFPVVSFRVPNERDDASTTQLRIDFPADQPIGAVRTTPVPGWKVKTVTRDLDQPIDVFGQQVDTAVSSITWTATGGGIGVEQFQDFALSLGPLPEADELSFNTVQTYSDGERVTWNEVSADPDVEPEHPAPVLHLTPAVPGANEDGHVEGGTAAESAVAADAAAAAGEDGGSGYQELPVALSGAALLVSLGALGLAWRRGRRPEKPARVGAAPERDREEARV